MASQDVISDSAQEDIAVAVSHEKSTQDPQQAKSQPAPLSGRPPLPKQDIERKSTLNSEHWADWNDINDPTTAALCATRQTLLTGQFECRGFERLHVRIIKFYEAQLKSTEELLVPPDTDRERERMERAGDVLVKYSQAIRDYEEMTNRPMAKEAIEPEQENWDSDRFIRNRSFGYGRIFAFRNRELAMGLADYDDFPSIWRATWRNVVRASELKDLLWRIAFALGSGATLLAPMLIMTFRKSQETRLIVICVAVVLFGTIMACTTTSRENIVAAVAAYAAVMVVYIGSASPSSS